MYDAYGGFRYDQTPSGLVRPYTPDPIGFGGQWGYYTDTETRLLNLTHRYYDAGAGRFLNRDPIGYNGGINLYGFAGNNPVMGRDPSGLDAYAYTLFGRPKDKTFKGRIGHVAGTHAMLAFDTPKGVLSASYNGRLTVRLGVNPVVPSSLDPRYVTTAEGPITIHGYLIGQNHTQDAKQLDYLIAHLLYNKKPISKSRFFQILSHGKGYAQFTVSNHKQLPPFDDCAAFTSDFLNSSQAMKSDLENDGVPSDLDGELDRAAARDDWSWIFGGSDPQVWHLDLK